LTAAAEQSKCDYFCRISGEVLARRLKECLIKGFALDDAKLKRDGGGDYFDEY